MELTLFKKLRSVDTEKRVGYKTKQNQFFGSDEKNEQRKCCQ